MSKQFGSNQLLLDAIVSLQQVAVIYGTSVIFNSGNSVAMVVDGSLVDKEVASAGIWSFETKTGGEAEAVICNMVTARS